MRLEQLRLNGFRNLLPLSICLEEDFHLFVGENAQGKTNLLEAIYLLATLKSFRAPRNRELIQWGEREALLEGRVRARGLARDHRLTIAARGRSLRVDGKTPRAVADYFEGIRAVCFTPEDLGMIRGAPQARRAFLDRLCFDLDPRHLGRIRQLNRCLKQRSALLRRQPGPSAAELQAFEPPLLDAAGAVLAARLRTLQLLEPTFAKLLGEVSPGDERTAALRYSTSLGPTETLLEAIEAGSEAQAEAEARSLMQAALDRVRRAELKRGMCLAGPQRDDLDVRLGDRSLRTYGSQGQVRSAALALKMGHRAVVTEALGYTPLFLLDDVGSELDRGRVERLMGWLKAAPGQVFMTATDAAHVPLSASKYRAWTVSNGAFAEG